VELSRSRLEVVLKVLDVDGAVHRVRGGWVSTGEPWHYDGERYGRLGEARRAEQQAMLDYQATDGCRMEFLLRQLDDPTAAPCGRCDNCTGRRWSAEVSGQASTAAQDRLNRPGVEIAPRRMWPSGMSGLGVPLSGKIPAGQQAEEGRALGRLTDIGWGNRLRELLAENAPDQPVPDDVFTACVQVLAAWKWSQRPSGVVTIGSRRRPKLVASLGERLASIGRLTYLGEITSAGEGSRRSNSAQRLAGLWQGLRAPESFAADGPVLLVDDLVDSGWTMTLAARLLREGGAPAVLPFALAVTN
jgi:ATP-dependent DNA helicase RecQ